MAAVTPLEDSQKASQDSKSAIKKRNMKPGRFTRGGRIYDSELGHTCHWCRQKTVEHHVFCCKCTIKFCGRCLLNRNGEDVCKEMLETVMWVCPKCRGGCGPGCSNCCNCGPCRIAQGLQPTGFLVKTARAVNFTNVHDFLVYKVTGESPDVIASRKLGRAWTSGGGALVVLPPSADSSLKRKSVALTEGPRKLRAVEGIQADVKPELSLDSIPSQEGMASPACPSNVQSAVDGDVDAVRCEPSYSSDGQRTVDGMKGWSFSLKTRPGEDCTGTLEVKEEDCDQQVSQECPTFQEEYSELDYTTTLEISREEEESEDSATSPQVKEEFEDCSPPSHFRKEGMPEQESHRCVGIGFESQDCLPEQEECAEWVETLKVKREYSLVEEKSKDCTDTLEVKREASPEQEELDVCTSAPQIKEEEDLDDWACAPDVEMEELPEEEWEGCTLAEVVKTEDAPGQVESTVCPFTRPLSRKNSEIEASPELEDLRKCIGSNVDPSSPLTGFCTEVSAEEVMDMEESAQAEKTEINLPGSPFDIVILEDEDEEDTKVSASRGTSKQRRHGCRCIRCAPKACTPVVKSNTVIALSDTDSEVGQQRRKSQSGTPPPRRRSYSRKLRDSFTCISTRAPRLRNTPQNVSQPCGPPTSLSANEFQQRLEMVLKESFCKQELKEKLELVTHRKPMEKERQMRQRAIPFTSSQQGLSYLDHYPGFADKLSAASDDEQKLTLLRGFFFWIQHPMLQGAFAPWTKAPENKSDSDDCMEIGPDCQFVCVRFPTETKPNPGRRVRRSLKYPAKRDQFQTLHKKSANLKVKAESEFPRPNITFV